MKNLETEFKWNAQTPYAFLKMLAAIKTIPGKKTLSSAKRLRITDVYADHADHRFERDKIAFRIRHYQDTWEATFKTRTELVNGKAVRREETQPLIKVKNLRQAFSSLSKQKTWKKLSLINLQPLFTIKNKRVLRQLTLPKLQAELSFDSCQIAVGEKRVFFKEIELEFKGGCQKSFDELAGYLSKKSGLKKSVCSKVKTAVSLLKK